MTDKTHIERLFREHYRQLHRLARMLLHDDDLALDIVHDVFASLLSGGKDATVTVGFLLNAVINRCLNHIRDTSVSQRLASQYYMDIEEYETEDWPDEETIKEIYLIIQSELTPRCRRAMELRFVEGLKFYQVAEAMGISEVAVYGHVRRAIETIRKKLNENGKL
ncbi:MAG: sigma-70 family RNA polymerase sigma factor [Muribaculaceae bacterium]|nr:sigma-70 family RNA polymerase sigma factor [Muribaculaceae bacterium]